MAGLEMWMNSMVYGRYNEIVFMGLISWFINQQTLLAGLGPWNFIFPNWDDDPI